MLKFASLIVAFGLITGQALAATCVVTSTADDGTAGTLRTCIANASAGDTITFSFASYPQTIQLMNITTSNPRIAITKNLTIVGPGSSNLTIKGYSMSNGAIFDVFDIFQPDPPANMSVSISGLTIADAQEGIYSSDYSYGVAGITTNVSLQDVDLLNCAYVGLEVQTGAVANISQSTISGNFFGLMADSDSSDPASVTNVSQSTIAQNYAGIYATYANTRVVNSTLFANGSSTNDGFSAGEIAAAASNTTFVFSTIDGAAATATPGIRAVDPTAAFTIKSSLLADHAAGNCTLDGTTAVSDGYNLDNDGTCVLSGTLDQSGTTSAPIATGLAETLASNGGLTQTDALPPTGPAIDWIPTADCADDQGNAVTVDQRNLTRPSGKGCDIGGFEYQNLTTPISVSLQLSGYPPSAANFSLVATFRTAANINPVTQAVGLQIGNYGVSIPTGSFKTLQNGSKTGSWVYSGVINGVSFSIQIVNNGDGSYQFKATGGTVNVGTQTPIPVTITIGNFVGTGSNESNVTLASRSK